MAHDYIPRPDGDFSAWANHYYEAVKKWWDTQGLDPTDLKPLEDAVTLWNKDYAAHVAAQAKAEAAAAAKRQARHGIPGGVPALEPEARRIAAFIQTYPKTTDADRATIGITVRQPTGGPPTRPTSRPLVRVDTSLRLRHTIRFTDEATPTRRARPKNTLGAEVRLKLVDPGETPPTDPEALRFLTLATNGVAAAEFPSEAGGKLAVYMLRWVGPRGAVGPWSEICTATVAA